jgi:hypothetical protein
MKRNLIKNKNENKRIIKNEYEQRNYIGNEILNINPNSQTLHPVSSQWINTSNLTNPICLTKFQLVNKEIEIFNNYKCKSDVNNYKQYLYLPPIGLSSNDLLKIYDIESIDRLNNWINSNLTINNFINLKRLLNCWIRINYETLKNYNNFLEKICIKIIGIILGDELKKIDNIEKESKYYVDYWINKNKGNEFELDIINDFILYLKKKYKL